MKKFFFIALVVLPFALQAQSKMEERRKKKIERRERINKLIKEHEDGALVYEKQNIFALKLATDGYGMFFEHSKYKTIKKSNLWWVELGEHKHKKEIKMTKVDGFGFAIGNPYIYGKVNNFYNLKLGVGQQRMIGGKASRSGVAVSAIYGAGLSLAMMKPYMLQVQDPTTLQVKDIKYADDETLFLDPNAVLGASGFTKGWGYTKFVPGALGRVGLRFDYGSFREVVSAIEVGINAEFYTKKIEQMAYQDPKRLFVTGFVAIEFGKRK